MQRNFLMYVNKTFISIHMLPFMHISDMDKLRLEELIAKSELHLQ